MSLLNLMSPPAAQTENSIAVIWDKPKMNIEEYHIYVNGELHGKCDCTDFTAANLESDMEYEIYVCAGNLKSDSIKVKTKKKTDIFDITEYGGVGDGKTLNTKAIQTAIDACTEGAMVYVPEGVFLTGAIYLKSDMILCVDGILLGSENLEDYPIHKYRFEGLETMCYASLVNTDFTCEGRMKNITICGTGSIDANGTILREKALSLNEATRGRAVCLRNADHVYLKDITVKHSPAWCVHLIYCTDITANNIKIYTKFDENGNPYNVHNGDGFDPDSCKNVYVFHSMIASQDDCIAIKSGKDEEGRKVGISTENVRITNCAFKSGFGVVIGSEMSGDVRNVFIQDCSFENVYSVGSVKCPRGRGGVIENIMYDHCTLKNYDTSLTDCQWFRGAICIDKFYSHIKFDPNKREEFNDGTPIIRNITFKNITLDTIAGNAIYLTGLPESPLENIYLENITAKGKYGLKANNVYNLVMDNVNVVSSNGEGCMMNNICE